MASAYLHRTNGTATNSQKMTFSTWFKIGTGATQKSLFGSVTGSGPYTQVKIMQLATHNNVFRFEASSIEGNAIDLKTNRMFRDCGAWYHLVVAIDTTQVSSSDRAKIYINGVQETSFATSTYPTQNDTLDFSASGVVAQVMAYNNTEHWDGVFAHTHFVDGLQYAASIFGETDTTSGIWVAKTSPSVTYGTNGFFLKYASGAITTDSSGNGNTMTQVGTITTTKDTPDNNMSTLYPDIPYPSGLTMTNGNTSIASTATQWAGRYSTQRVFSGKYYVEAQFVSTGHNLKFGVQGADPSETTNWSTLNTSYAGKSAVGYEFQCNNGNGYKVNNNSSPRWTESDFTPATSTIMMAFDLDNGKIWWGRNGTWFDSGGTPNPATGTDAAFTGITTANGPYLFGLSLEGNGSSSNINFGNGYYASTAIGSPVTANEGTWAYAPPTGFGAVNTNWINTF